MPIGDKWGWVEIEDGKTQPKKLANLLQIGHITEGPVPSLSIRFEGDINRYLDIVFPDVTTAVAEAIGTATEALAALEEVSAMIANDEGALGALMTSLGNKVDKEAGKGLSANDLTDALLATLNSALQDPTAFDPAGSANVAKDFAVHRSHHTGTQLAATISDFTTAVLAATASAYASASQGSKADTAVQPSDMTAAVAAEATSRASGDAANAAAITAETTARQSAVTAEASTRASADTTNANAIAAETSARQSADTTLTTAVNAKAPSSRTIATTAPLLGGGDLSADRTLSVAAATTSAAGSMSAADKTKLDGIAAGATALALASTAPANLGAAAAVGTGTTAARSDHVHKGPVIGTGSASTAAVLLAGASVDLVVNLDTTMPDTAYKASAILSNSSVTVMGNLTVTVKTKATTSVTVTLKNNGLASIALGQAVEVIAISPAV